MTYLSCENERTWSISKPVKFEPVVDTDRSYWSLGVPPKELLGYFSPIVCLGSLLLALKDHTAISPLEKDI